MPEPVLYATQADGGRVSLKKLRSPAAVSGQLEIPSGRNAGQNAWLTLTLGYTFTFLDRRTPDPKDTKAEKQVLFYSGSGWYARDLSGYMFPILDWDGRAIEAFHKKFRLGESIWNHKFQITTPANYDQFDYRSGGITYRPNVLCLFRMTSGVKSAQNFNVVRLDPDVTEVMTEDGKKTKRVKYPEGFRSSEGTLSDGDWRTPVLGHELGHALGQTHIKGLLGDEACLQDPNAKRCYGTTPEELLNIMGIGREITKVNGGPWCQHLAHITGTHPTLCKLELLTHPTARPVPPTKLINGKKIN
jgi:hypothetical protein